MFVEPGDAERLHAGLPGAEKIAFAAQAQVFLRDAEAVVALAHDGKARLGRFAERRLVEEHAGRGLVAAPDAPAQLVKLRQAEALGMLDHDDGGIRHVDATSITVVATTRRVAPDLKSAMTRSFSSAFIRPCTSPTRSPKNWRSTSARSSAAVSSLLSLSSTSGQTQVELIALLDRLPGARDDVVEALEGDGDRGDRLAAGRLPVEARDVHVAEGSQHQRAGNGRRRHHEEVGRAALAGEAEALVDAEPVAARPPPRGRGRCSSRRPGTGRGCRRRCRPHRWRWLRASPCGRGRCRGRSAARSRGPPPRRSGQGRRNAGARGFPSERGARIARRIPWPPPWQAKPRPSSGAHIALQQAQHADGLRHIGMDFGKDLLLAVRQREGQRGLGSGPHRTVAPRTRPGFCRALSRASARAIWLASSSS